MSHKQNWHDRYSFDMESAGSFLAIPIDNPEKKEHESETFRLMRIREMLEVISDINSDTIKTLLHFDLVFKHTEKTKQDLFESCYYQTIPEHKAVMFYFVNGATMQINPIDSLFYYLEALATITAPDWIAEVY